MSDYIDELVNSACCCRLNAFEPHADHCDHERLASFARAVAAAVEARARVCKVCGGSKIVMREFDCEKIKDRCRACHARGVVFALDEGGT